MAGLAYIRNPNEPAELNVGVPLMPLSLGDAGKAFLTVSQTQYFFLEQWSKGNCGAAAHTELGPANTSTWRRCPTASAGATSRASRSAIRSGDPSCTTRIGGPRIAGPSGSNTPMTRRDTNNFSRMRTGPKPVLTVGWLPFRDNEPLEPGDICKFMAIPWQTDYNSCSIHQTKINTAGVNNTNGNALTLYWSWPSQRPDAVYPATDVVAGVLPDRSGQSAARAR